MYISWILNLKNQNYIENYDKIKVQLQQIVLEIAKSFSNMLCFPPLSQKPLHLQERSKCRYVFDETTVNLYTTNMFCSIIQCKRALLLFFYYSYLSPIFQVIVTREIFVDQIDILFSNIDKTAQWSGWKISNNNFITV